MSTTAMAERNEEKVASMRTTIGGDIHAKHVDYPVKVSTRGLDLFYGAKQALKSVTLEIQEKRVTAFIGPSGCGKSTYLRTLNRMNDTIVGCKITGEVIIDGVNVYDPRLDVVGARVRVARPLQVPASRHQPRGLWRARRLRPARVPSG